MIIISIEQQSDDLIKGYVDLGDSYARFRSTPNESSIDEDLILKSKYENYEHFVGVMSKFCPEIWFLEKPIEAESLAFEYLKSIIPK
ncbi:MAG: hypothetical protein EOM37_14210 [Proteobacteria bacterium]|nr:hypothetical protein [Pseudomonadota bacterium]